MSPRYSTFMPLLASLAFISIFIGACTDGDKKSAQQAPPALEVEAYEVQAKDTPVSFEFVGKTASSRRVEIRSRVEGFLERQMYVEGSTVKAGDIMFQIDKKPFAAQLSAANAELAQQQARMETALINLNRVRPLVKKKAVAQKELDDATGTYRSAAAAVEAARANVVQAELNLGYTDITSPVSGPSSSAAYREGAYISYNAGPLTYVAQIDPMWIEFSITENQILRFRDEKKRGTFRAPEDGAFEIEIILADGTVYPQRGHITFSDASLSEETGTFLIRAEIDNKEKALRPGQFVRTRILGGIRPKAILVPKQAVQQGAKGSFVWLISKDGKAQFQPVTVGNWRGDNWFIENGLKNGDTLVSNGAMKVRAGAPLTIKPAQTEATDNSAQ
ncbi:MAG: efflux RND transporter periplasmic adaptor subunit [gamma proteobacterium symbiont of Bathyaustriella thionipta]|nr:efflux RND transporter periplasmic adaptor subunit [gamma proteobacterium symbiont of Bathyaustriella thionipta]